MFRRQFLSTSQLIGRRYASTSAATKATSALNSITGKASDLLTSATYWSKVTLELSKYVYEKEFRAPPSVEQFKAAFTTVLNESTQIFTKYARNPTSIVDDLSQSYGNGNLLRYSAYTVQLIGLFSVGEIIGRRHIYGYPDHDHHA